jgi:molecular chaperone GrpE
MKKKRNNLEDEEMVFDDQSNLDSEISSVSSLEDENSSLDEEMDNKVFDDQSNLDSEISYRISSLEDENSSLKKKLEDQERDYLLKLADLENMRKRMDRDRATFKSLANEKLILDFLDVLDNLERANQSEGDIKSGVNMIITQFKTLLERENVVAIEREKFDPHFHHAVSIEKGDKDEIIEVRKGYMLKDKVIRPTLVKLTEKEI